jgi:phage tail-like protein
MSDTTGKEQNAIWPLPKFYFSVTWGSATINFSEVSGLDNEVQVIEYRHGDSPSFYPIKMPGLGKVGNVTMKRGVFVGDTKYWDWFNQIQLNTISGGRLTVTIQLLNEKNQATMTWELQNAWPSKITSTDLKSDGNEAAIDTIEIVYERLVVTNKNNP